jgi:hypothetical protein
VPYVPGLAKAPPASLIDLVAFTNGQAGKANPQRQGLGSAIKDGADPLNIPANTPASPAYSPLWAVNLVQWRDKPGDRQTSVAAVKALEADGKVAGFDPMAAAGAAPAPVGPSGIVVNCPIIAALGGADAAGDAAAPKPFLRTLGLDVAAGTVRLPLHRARLADGGTAYYIVTEASTPEAAAAWGASHAPALASAAAIAQRAKVVTPAGQGGGGGGGGGSRGLLQANESQGAGGELPLLQVPATVNFARGKRSVTPDPKTGFPPTAFNFSAQGNPGGWGRAWWAQQLPLPDRAACWHVHVSGGQLLCWCSLNLPTTLLTPLLLPLPAPAPRATAAAPIMQATARCWRCPMAPC